MRGKTIAYVFVAAALLASAGLVFPAASASTQAADEPFEPRGVMDLLYLGLPDSALAVLEARQAAEPLDPFVRLLKAKVMRERLNDEDRNKELIRQTTDPIHAVIDSAIALAEEALERDPKEPKHYYHRGYGWMSKAQLYVLTRSYWSAGRAASRGKDDLERYLEWYPDDADARGILGAYYYFADIIPGVVKLVAKLLLIPGGDRDKGLEMLRYAASRDGIFSTDWRFVLAAIDLVFEGEFEKGTEEFDGLLAEFPCYTRLAEPLAVVAPLYPARTLELRSTVGAAVDRHLTLDEKNMDLGLEARLRLLNAFTDSFFGSPRRAVVEFTDLIDHPAPHPDWLLPIALINRGYMFEKTGRLDRARADYEAVGRDPRGSHWKDDAAQMLGTLGEIPAIDFGDLEFVSSIYRGAYIEADSGLARFESRNGESVMTDFYRGDLEALEGDLAAAWRSYTRALSREAVGGDEIFQTLSAARLAEIAGASGRYEEAKNHMKRAREYHFVNYLLRFLLESRERYYESAQEGERIIRPSVFTPPPDRG